MTIVDRFLQSPRKTAKPVHGEEETNCRDFLLDVCSLAALPCCSYLCSFSIDKQRLIQNKSRAVLRGLASRG